jgi:ISXO2-like transposase domain
MTFFDGRHSNTVEGFHCVFKRGTKGIYQHCKEKHLHSYLCEFDSRYFKTGLPLASTIGNARTLSSGARLASVQRIVKLLSKT